MNLATKGKIALIEEYLDGLRRVLFEDLRPSEKIFNALNDFQFGYRQALCILVGDNTDLIKWYIQDNDFGRAGKELFFPDQTRKIKSVEDLVWAIEKEISQNDT